MQSREIQGVLRVRIPESQVGSHLKSREIQDELVQLESQSDFEWQERRNCPDWPGKLPCWPHPVGHAAHPLIPERSQDPHFLQEGAKEIKPKSVANALPTLRRLLEMHSIFHVGSLCNEHVKELEFPRQNLFKLFEETFLSFVFAADFILLLNRCLNLLLEGPGFIVLGIDSQGRLHFRQGQCVPASGMVNLS